MFVFPQYCECFRNGRHCAPHCRCKDCYNTPDIFWSPLEGMVGISPTPHISSQAYKQRVHQPSAHASPPLPYGAGPTNMAVDVPPPSSVTTPVLSVHGNTLFSSGGRSGAPPPHPNPTLSPTCFPLEVMAMAANGQHSQGAGMHYGATPTPNNQLHVVPIDGHAYYQPTPRHNVPFASSRSVADGTTDSATFHRQPLAGNSNGYNRSHDSTYAAQIQQEQHQRQQQLYGGPITKPYPQSVEKGFGENSKNPRPSPIVPPKVQQVSQINSAPPCARKLDKRKESPTSTATATIAVSPPQLSAKKKEVEAPVSSPVTVVQKAMTREEIARSIVTGGGSGVGGMTGAPECTCRRSRCLKKYCDCVRAQRPCGPACKCKDCLNPFRLSNKVHPTLHRSPFSSVKENRQVGPVINRTPPNLSHLNGNKSSPHTVAADNMHSKGQNKLLSGVMDKHLPYKPLRNDLRIDIKAENVGAQPQIDYISSPPNLQKRSSNHFSSMSNFPEGVPLPPPPPYHPSSPPKFRGVSHPSMDQTNGDTNMNMRGGNYWATSPTSVGCIKKRKNTSQHYPQPSPNGGWPPYSDRFDSSNILASNKSNNYNSNKMDGVSSQNSKGAAPHENDHFPPHQRSMHQFMPLPNHVPKNDRGDHNYFYNYSQDTNLSKGIKQAPLSTPNTTQPAYNLQTNAKVVPPSPSEPSQQTGKHSNFKIDRSWLKEGTGVLYKYNNGNQYCGVLRNMDGQWAFQNLGKTQWLIPLLNLEREVDNDALVPLHAVNLQTGNGGSIQTRSA
uniref:CRC domain-containing protein n=1 Tax=Corethron hystrix TaxID=216773 RepID=A0A7S1G299_9STRA|mmetsp:Transcript_9886/g.22058  ORF Transcript_9886/g.22058 Transcript_9886/m.22058 type:complete len:780 (+) Transcript_9886:142-2481(+)